jgi:hypothetical protein
VAADRLVDRVRKSGLERRVQPGVARHLVALRPGCIQRGLDADDAARERAGLVGAQDRDLADVLDRREPAHDDALARHVPRPLGERDAHDGGQQLGSESDREREREEQRIEHGAVERHVDRENPERHHRGHLEQPVSEPAYAPLEFRFRGVLGEPPRNSAENGPGARCHDERRRRTVYHVGAREQRVRAPREGSFGGHGAGRLLRGVGLAGQRRLVHVQVFRIQDPRIARRAVARDEQDDVSRHHVVGRNGRRGAVAQHRYVRLHHREQRLDRYARAPFLPEAEEPARKYDRDDDGGVGRLVQHEREARRGEEQQGNRATELRP